MGKRNKQRKIKAEARRRRGFGDDILYRQVKRFSVRVGDTMTVNIGELDQEGIGIVRIGSLTVKIPGSKIGEKVKIRIDEMRGSSATAQVMDRT